MPSTIKEIIKILYSEKFLNILEKKFNLTNLEPDWSLTGGGMHQSFKGGFLKFTVILFIKESLNKNV